MIVQTGGVIMSQETLSNAASDRGETIVISYTYWKALHEERTEALAVVREALQYLAIERRGLQNEANEGTAERLEHANRDRKVDQQLAQVDKILTQGNMLLNRELPSADPRDHPTPAGVHLAERQEDTGSPPPPPDGTRQRRPASGSPSPRGRGPG